jgi:hypothetical protein
MEMGSAHLCLAIDPDSDPISGSVEIPGHAPVPFTGWIDLVAAIENARAARVAGGGKTLGCLPGAKLPKGELS